MHRRYTIHRDGDLLVEELDAQGKPIEAEPVPAEDRMPIELTLLSPDGDNVARAALLDLVELALEMEHENEGQGPSLSKSFKLNVLN